MKKGGAFKIGGFRLHIGSKMMARRQRRKYRGGRRGSPSNRLDRNLQITCEACKARFSPLKDFSVKKMLLYSFPLVIPGWLYFKNRFKCPKCHTNQHHKLGELRGSR